MNNENGESKFAPGQKSDFPVWYDHGEAITRFRSAIKRAGGIQVVAKIAGVPKGTINNLLRGTDIRISNAYAIAAACHVSMDWLATGIGAETPEWYVPGPTTGSAMVPLGPSRPESKPPVYQPEEIRQSPPVPGMAEHPESIAPPLLIDPDHLQQAIEIVKVLDGVAAFAAPNIGRRLAAAYDILSGAKP